MLTSVNAHRVKISCVRELEAPLDAASSRVATEVGPLHIRETRLPRERIGC